MVSAAVEDLLRRDRFFCAPSSQTARSWEKALLLLLIAQDSSTTLLLETLADRKMSVNIIDQSMVSELPCEIDGILPGKRFLRRTTSLHVAGNVVRDSLSYIAIDQLPPPIVKELEAGAHSIGHVLSRVWTRRMLRDLDLGLLTDLWSVVGEPDPPASRSSILYTPRAPCVLMGETFRRGALDLLAPESPGSHPLKFVQRW